MLTSILRASLLTMPMLLCASCARYPASPVPAALTDMQAARLADDHFVKRDGPPLLLLSEEQQGDGWLLAYESMFDRTGAPPKQSRLILVKNDGRVREIEFSGKQR